MVASRPLQTEAAATGNRMRPPPIMDGEPDEISVSFSASKPVS
jgi:hypothetical protein